MDNQSSFGDFVFKPLTDEEKVAMKEKRIIQDEWMERELWLNEVKERSKQLEVWLDKGMSIDRQKTFDEKGYWVEDLLPKSHEKVWAVCIQCGKYRWMKYYQYHDLCKQCSVSGENNPFYGRQHSEESCQKMSESHIGLQSGENNPMYGRTGKDSPCYGRTGEKHPMFGKHHSDESKKRIIESTSGENSYMFGKHMSKESRIKSSCTHQGITLEEFTGFTHEKHVIFRRSAEYAKWRTAVFERDSYTCQECGVHGIGDLQAHHITPFNIHPEPEYSLNTDNGVTLCKACHYKTIGREDEFYNKYTDIVKCKSGFKGDFLESSVILEGLKKQNNATRQLTLF